MSQTKYVNLDKLRRAPGSTIIIRLVLAINDLSTVNYLVAHLATVMPPTDRGQMPTAEALEGFDRAIQPAMQGHIRYAMRMMSSHLYEGGRALDAFQDKPALRVVLNHHMRRADVAWEELNRHRASTKWKTHVKRVRHNIGFHYNHDNDSKVLAAALDRRVDVAGVKLSPMTVSTGPTESRFKLGDDMIDSTLAQILGVPSGKGFTDAFYEELGFQLSAARSFALVTTGLIEDYLDYFRLFY